MADMCTDNRFKLIEKYKKALIDSTNIESAQDEMAVLDDLLFRFWQMGWLDRLEQPERRWIPCSERLPEDGLYLVTTSKGQVQVHVFSHNGNSEEYWMRCNKAWMPLPKPYKGERGRKE